MGFAGIDLGNTRTKVAVPDAQGAPVMQPNDMGELFTLSCVYIDDNRIIVGSEALNAGLLDPSRFVQNWKRAMGTDKVLATVDGKAYLAKDIARILLEHVARNYQQKTGEILSEASISVPANYNDRQKAETQEAARAVGIDVVCLPHEPTAATLGNGLEKRGDGLVALLDLGGGTFDVSLVRVSGNTLEVIATNGEPHLGGQDFTQRILDQTLEAFEADHGFRLTPKDHALAYQDLVQRVEQAKLTLSIRDSAQIMVNSNGTVGAYPVTRQELADRTRDLLDKAMQRTIQTLAEAGVSAGDLREILPVGGASQMPCFLEAIEAALGRKPATHAEPYYAVALGAMTLGRLEIERRDGQFSSRGRKLPPLDYRMHDVTAHPIGVAVLAERGGLANSVILDKGQPIPSDHTKAFQLAEPDQTAAVIDVLQGTDGATKDACQAIGEFELKGLTPVPGPHRIDIRLRIDRNGMLSAEAWDPEGGQRADLKIHYGKKRKAS